jgi:hypothetical protein
VADALSRCPNLLHVAGTQANICAPVVNFFPDEDRASRKQSLGMKSPSHGTVTPNSQSETTTGDSGPAFLAMIAEALTPDGVESLLEDIAEWYKLNTAAEQVFSPISFTKRNGLWHYGEQIIVPDDEKMQQRCIAVSLYTTTDPQQGTPIEITLLSLFKDSFGGLASVEM